MKPAGLLIAAATAIGCGGTRSVGPPELTLGQLSCEACAMTVSDGRVAAAIIAVDASGARREVVFDDQGCALVYEAAHPELGGVVRYARDYEADGWIAAETATFLRSDGIATPMRYGIAAFATPERAEAARAARGGEVLRLDALRARASRGELRPQAAP